MDPKKRKLQKTVFPLKYSKQFNPALEYTHTFHTFISKFKKLNEDNKEHLITYPEDNVHNTLYHEAIKYTDREINAIDVGCRDGEFTRYLTWNFNHVYCYDYRYRVQFPMNINLSKVTHYQCAVGKEISQEYASGRGELRNSVKDQKWINKDSIRIYPLDYFKLKDINLIKVDVDGMDKEVIEGAVEIIKKCKPVIVIEEIILEDGTINHTGVEFIKSLGYKTVHIKQRNPNHKDYILVHNNNES